MDKKIVMIICLIGLIGLGVFVCANNSFYKVDSNYQVTVEVTEGWNLIQGFHPDLISAGSQVTFSNIKVIWMYSPDKNKYFQLYPKMELPNSELDSNDEYYDDYINLYSYWVYVENLQTCNSPACESPGSKLNKLVYTLDPFGNLMDNLILKKGWNFVGMNPEMYHGVLDGAGYEDEYFSWDSRKGSCQYENIYAWDFENQDWVAVDSNLVFQEYDFDDFLGNGMLVKVSSDCTLGESGSTTNPPGLPGGNEDSETEYLIEEDISNPPLILENWELKENRNEPLECREISTMPDNPLGGYTGEACASGVTLQYKNLDSDKGVFVKYSKISKGLDFYEEYFSLFNQITNIGSYSVYRLEPAELWWWISEDELIMTQEYTEISYETGVSYNYGELAIGNNPVAEWIVNEYPPYIK